MNELSIYNLLGEELMNWTDLRNKTKLQLINLPKGAYLAVAKTDALKKSFKLYLE